jgi:hypothetical protein
MSIDIDMTDSDFDCVVTVKELQENFEDYIDSGEVIGILGVNSSQVRAVMIPYQAYELMLKDLDIFAGS